MEKIERIIAKFLVNSITSEELDELSIWLREPENEQIFYDLVKVNHTTNYIMGNFDNEEIKRFLLTKIKNDKRSIYWGKFGSTIKYAATIAVLLVLGLVYRAIQHEEHHPPLLIEDKSISLKLANGEVKIMKEDGTFEMVNEKGEVVAKQNGGQLTYNNGTGQKKLQYNQLNVPYGKQMQLTLSDGTLVYLNAGSSLRYPVEFIEDEGTRQVFLQGEAFFDVTKNESAPFLVNTDGINVQVLGTQFSVSSYSDDPATQVVLVEGSVELLKNAVGKNNEPIVLVPGEKGELGRYLDAEIQVERVNTELYTSWMKGELLFRKSTLGNMLRTLERYYNITVVNTNKDFEGVLFNASFKKEPIENILIYLDDVLGMDYTIENNTVIIN
ncbi:FecR family protein [Flagellimonas sp.]|uniref:FecR family protein n=1 Tax=Flagellimonas sp. TaxID=2058762 RepID=UPI003BAE8C89